MKVNLQACVSKYKKIIRIVLFLLLPLVIELFFSRKVLFEKATMIRLAILYGIGGLFLLYQIANHYKDKLKKLLDFIIRKRYIFVLVIFVIAVACNINFSSMHIWRNFLHEDAGSRPLFGTAREIRADEWLVQTPALLAQTKNPEGYSLKNEHVMQGNGSMLLTNAAVWDITTISKPLIWGFLLFGAEYGVSWWWMVRVLLLLMGSFEIARIISKKDNLLSLTGMFLLGLAPAMLWWLSTSIVDTYIFGMAIVVLFYYYMEHLQWKLWKKLCIALGMLITIPAFVFAIYPAYQVPLALVMAVFILYAWIKYGKELKKQDYIIMGMTIVGVVVILGYFLMVAWPGIQTMMSTVYPGSRFETGGNYTLRQFVAGFTNIFLPYTDDIANPCEISTYLYPVCGLFVLLIYYFKNKKESVSRKLSREEIADKFLEIALMLLFAFFLVWLYVGFHRLLAKFSFLSMSPTERTAIVCNFIGVLLLLGLLKKFEGKTIFNKVQAVIFSVCITFIAYVLIKNSTYASFFTTVKLEIFSVLLWVMTYTVVTVNKKAFCYTMCIVSVIAGIAINPICTGLDIFYETQVAEQIQQIVEKDPEALWIGRYNWSGQYALANGANVLNGVNLYPNFTWLKIVDPTGKDEQVYNRYAHIGILLSDHTEFRLLTQDSYEVELTYQNLKDIGACYYFTDTKCSSQIEEQFHLKIQYEDDEKLQYIYQIE